jgi:hypothetical protein
MYAMNIQNDVIGLVLRENCKSKQMTDIIAWPSRCHGRIWDFSVRKILWKAHRKYLCKKYSTLFSKKNIWHGIQEDDAWNGRVTVWDIFIRIRKTVKFWTESSWFPRFFDFSVLYYMHLVNIYFCSVMIYRKYILWVVYHYSTTNFPINCSVYISNLIWKVAILNGKQA